uniref:NAC transcription factor 044 n=1 Tax=Rhizophora mucronata TaxID=61149 RepID=A0A2P2P4B3_RHIMU
MDWSPGKNGNVSIIVSFSLPQGDARPGSLLPISSFFSGKTGSVMSGSWLFLMFFWVLLFAASFKTGTYICAK